jgi:DNA-directed RNA polymerase specialized sigma54-like protein
MPTCHMFAGETTPPADALEICVLADLMLSDLEIHRPTVTKAIPTKYLDTETGAMRKIKLLLLNCLDLETKWLRQHTGRKGKSL